MEKLSIIVEAEGKTSEEKNLALLHALEKQFKTGPIIGEARELILHLSDNLLVRDLLLSSMGFTDKKREQAFFQISEYLIKKDEEIMAAREAKSP